MRISYLLVLTLFSACSDASDKPENSIKSEYCEINFTSNKPCINKGISALLRMTSLADDEKSLDSIDVTYKGTKQTLSITPDTSLIEGDRGNISFKDINFDGIPDIAITTSFGLANLYLDYWVFNEDKKKFIFLGNYAEMKLNKKDKTVSNTIRLNAAEYQNNRYKWNGYQLVKY